MVNRKIDHFDLEEESRELIFKNKQINYNCFTCDMTGKIRNNKSTKNGYVFKKTKCPNCLGTGQRKAN